MHEPEFFKGAGVAEPDGGVTGADGTPRFELLEMSGEDRRRRRAIFGASSVMQIAVLGLSVWLLTKLPSRVRELGPTNRVWRITLLVPPSHMYVPRRPRAAPTPAPRLSKPPKPQIKPPQVKPVVRLAPAPTIAAPLPVPKLKLAPKLSILRRPARPIFPATEAAKPVPPKVRLQTHVGAFNSGGSPAKAKLPPNKVQTGGFGSPNGLPGEARGGSRGNVPHLGSFDRPDGPGAGNGTGGARGARTMVASAGFGSGVAQPGSYNGRPRQGEVAAAGFANAQSLTHAAPSSKPRLDAASYDPVEITAKPDPVYTAEARRLHIQGEVLLRVIFTASGEMKIVGVARGLGHGLDEVAIRAAQQIQFKPARRDGRPVDTPAVLHILFQLAN